MIAGAGFFDVIRKPFQAAGNFLFGDSGRDPQAFRAPGFEQQGLLLDEILRRRAAQGGDPFTFAPGQSLPGQLQSFLQSQQFLPPPDIPLSFQSRQPFQFQTPGDPFQFSFRSFDPINAVGDAFTPEFERAQRALQRFGTEEREGIQEDLNRRGLLTAGATTEALTRQRREERDLLADVASRLAADQARQRLGAYQFASQLNFQQQAALQAEAARRQALDVERQRSQAEELFRQQGATDAQARALADDALQRRTLALEASGQAFRENLAGRELALNELQLANQQRRMSTDDLLRLFALSSGATPGVPATPGFLSTVAGGFGSALGQRLGTGIPFFGL